MQQPVTLFGETDSQRCARLEQEIISNAANRPSDDAEDEAAGGSGTDWTPARPSRDESGDGRRRASPGRRASAAREDDDSESGEPALPRSTSEAQSIQYSGFRVLRRIVLPRSTINSIFNNENSIEK